MLDITRSTMLLTNFGTTCNIIRTGCVTLAGNETNRWRAPVKAIEAVVQYVAIELDGRDLLDG